ncbi:hypothetical protein C3B55_00999 [Candidatus Pseudomonas adelgestsugas]|uniref:Orphan protein n=1 Tax=Candidatus Pseudomonas adelgestsugas TaxID=1302376 RepID=A0ABX5RAB8_9PSED|nr:hypothetical protein C3B55_00999 [Candidatus Pseudomonas adelgestsugas]
MLALFNFANQINQSMINVLSIALLRINSLNFQLLLVVKADF